MALAKANRLESLYRHSKRPQSSLRGPGGTTERRTDRPTDRQTNKKGFENMQNGFDPCFHHAKRNRTHMTCKTRLCKNFPKQVQVLPLSAGNLGRSHKSTPPLDRRFPDPVLSSSRRQTPQVKSCAYVPQSARPGANGDPKRSLSKALQAAPAGL